jgi:SAM-dependent methyltransferase
VDVTSRFVLDFVRRFASAHPGAAVLDFGCGGGGLVAAARAEGLCMRGADVFYSGSNARAEAEAAGLLGSAVLEIHEGRLPFPSACFDLVVNNQVMEHVADLDAVLAEIARVLKPGATLLSIFPARDVWREGHIGIPFSHRLPRGSRLRFLYTLALRTLGCGTWKQQNRTRREWTRAKLDWIDRYTFYRPRREIFAAYSRHFQSELRERDYIGFRLRDRAWRAPLARAVAWAPLAAPAEAVFRKLAFLVIRSRKEGA